MDIFRTKYWQMIKTFFVTVLMSFFLASVSTATPVDGYFELETNANAIDDSPADGTADDWDTPPYTGSADVFSLKSDMEQPDTIFTGGNKDIHDIPALGWKTGSILDKGDILHAYSAAYTINGELFIVFGADRYDNNGDAFLGFWFFQQKVGPKTDGTFSGAHTPRNDVLGTRGDLLIQVNYLQSANEGPEILVLEWDPSCKKAAGPKPEEGTCAAENLFLLKKANALCQPGLQDVCASTNLDPALVPTVDLPDDEYDDWLDYVSKDGDTDYFPEETFFEGAVNISKLIGNTTCFSSFSAETRASSSITAQLKDFVMDDFDLCSVSITKTCNKGTPNPDGSGFTYTYDLLVKNTGFGTLYDVTVTDVLDPSLDGNVGTLAAGDTETLYGSFTKSTYSATFDNKAEVEAASSSGGAKTITDSDTVACTTTPPEADIFATKYCENSFEVKGDYVVAKVGFTGQVCNYSDYPLTEVKVTDDSGAVVYASDNDLKFEDRTLAPKDDVNGDDCINYYGSYYPSTIGGQDQTKDFKDTITATGKFSDAIGGDTASFDTSAECDLCPAD
ncbi:MAG: DUF11 domain-containing protein [Vibrionaceae bacterium]|nr:DUF11 domain-containing protein [Vibrionaceae bacterium]